MHGPLALWNQNEKPNGNVSHNANAQTTGPDPGPGSSTRVSRSSIY